MTIAEKDKIKPLTVLVGMQSILAAEDLTDQHLEALVYLYENGPLDSITEICRAVRIKPPNGSRLIGLLKDRNLISYEVNGANKRTVKIELTETGKEKLERIAEDMERLG